MTDFEISLERLKDVEPQDNWTEADWTHLKTIQKALEMRVAKKPLEKSSEYNGDYGICPCCAKSVSDFDDVKVCSSCGQALDWSDNDKNE